MRFHRLAFVCLAALAACTPDDPEFSDAAVDAVPDVPIDLTWQPAIPSGRVVVHAGTLFDGRSPAVRTDVDVVIRDNRIEQVVDHRADLHQGRFVDASDGVVMPGLIEMHTHLSKDYGEALGRIWLSYGITSVRNPAANAYDAQEDRKSVV